MTAVGGEPGLMQAENPARLAVPTSAPLDVPDGTAAGLVALVPGYGETLRINGRLRTGDRPSLEVEEAFLHCAKAMIRSRLWDDPPQPRPSITATWEGSGLNAPEIAGFIGRSPFLLLGSVDGRNEADVSPKGDPAGFALILDDHTLAIPDRPGNRRTDTLHNLLDRPEIGAMALVPGEDHAVVIRGRAHTTADDSIRSAMTMNGKVPNAAVVIDVEHVEIRTEPAIAAAHLWDTARHVDRGTLPRATKVWVDHVKRNQDPGLAAKAARKMINEKVMSKGIDHDYRTNLY